MANFKQDILHAVGSEVIEAIVILNLLEPYEYEWRISELRDASIKPFVGKILTWEEAAPLLDYNYDDGFGSMDCHDVEIYTATNVYYIHEYDGSTPIRSVPRNPTAHKQEI